MKMKKQYIYIFSIVLGVMILGFSLAYYVNDGESLEEKRANPKKIRIIKNVIKEPSDIREKTAEISMDDVFAVEELPQEASVILSEEEKSKILQKQIQEQLEMKMHFIYKECKKINTKKGIQEKLQKKQYKDVFLSDLEGNTLYGSNDTEDIYARTIILEEIQKIGKYGKGFIVSNVDSKGTKRYIFVKDLELSNLFLGVDVYY